MSVWSPTNFSKLGSNFFGTLLLSLIASLITSPSVAIATPLTGISSVSSPQSDSGYLTTSETATVTVTFTSAVTVSGGTPSLTLETGVNDASAIYAGGSGTDTLTF